MDSSTVSFRLLLGIFVYLRLDFPSGVQAAMDSCFDQEGTPSRCMPKFENAAFNRTVLASNVCGSPPEDYCMQTGSTRLCHRCDAAEPSLSHSGTHLTDFHSDEEPTWWQSQSMYYGIQHPNSVNLTLHLGKAFEITYVRLKFYTSRPESFAIYKRTEADGPWTPYQYYSASCRKTYGKDAKGYIRPGDNERAAVCTDEFSDISPLTGGNVAFSTLEGRPSAYNFDQSSVLQEWVTATDLLISLDRINTFGDEFFKDAKVLRSYFYAISDFTVGGRCKCNGHASECMEGDHGGLVCACQHHTVGADCQKCHPFYQDRPWARATGESANECLKCNCSGRSDECVFDPELYRSNGHGGRCLSCSGNTDGPFCERCRDNYYRDSPTGPCLPCHCNSNGSASLQCDSQGRCVCQHSVMADKCDTCLPGSHSLGPGGCRPCQCDLRGSVGDCSPLDGGCYCKTNVEGRACDKCKPGFLNLQQANPIGCQSCFCFGHSLACSSSNQHAAFNITSDFINDQEGWLGEFSGGLEYPLLWKEGEVYLLPLTEDDTGFYKAPEKFLGQQAYSYGQLLFITFTSESPELLPHNVTLILEGSGRFTLSADLSPEPASQIQDQDHGIPPVQTFTVRLHEDERRFKPAISTFDLQHLLHNVTSLRISNVGGHNYTSQLSGVTLASAVRSAGPADGPAPWVETCSCPQGFTGHFCERCGPGFTREDPGRGALSACVPCNCHRHGPCHPETGACQCSDFTAGSTCERCLDGYHGNALIGTPGDCQPCPCPDRTSCARTAHTGEVVCTNCPTGQAGSRCQRCDDGYHGDPLGQSGPVRPCARCECNGNVDPNAVGVCDHVTGRCRKCLGHTGGDHCERCQQGFYGNALSQTPRLKCKSCSCSALGTSGPLEECHPQTGECQCLPHATGRDCGHCWLGFFNLQPGIGCERCHCNAVGSSSTACHPITGQCLCRTGVEGRLCDSCRSGFFGFSSRGCRACNCDPMGSVSMQCYGNGTCQCRPGFVGYKCDKCELNYFHNRDTHQCEECPVCYGLVKQQAEKLRGRLQDLEKLLGRFSCQGRTGQHRDVLRYHMHQQQDYQGEGDLPNALEDFLAIQEAREAFVKQFSALESSARALSRQLHGVGAAFGCNVATTTGDWEEGSGEESGERTDACQTFADAQLIVTESMKLLKQSTLDLDDMIIPFEVASGPNDWYTVVNESQVIMNSHRQMADYIDATARRALKASNQTFLLLLDLLQDNSTEEYIRNLTKQLSDMQQMKRSLAAQVSETTASQMDLEESYAGLHAGLNNHTGLNLTSVMTHLNEGVDLLKRAEELASHVQTKEELVGKIQEEMEPLLNMSGKNLELADSLHEMKAQAQGAKVMALSSVVTAKQVESESIALHRELEYMQREWPRREAQTRAAVKKHLGAKVLADVRRRVHQVEKTLQSALENSSLSNTTATEAVHIAHIVAKESKAALTQAKHTRTASGQLSSHLDMTLQLLAEQENLTATARSQITAEAVVSLTNVKEDMEAAKLQLEVYSSTLTELIRSLDEKVPLERYDRVLDETASRLNVLRGSVESPALGSKIQRLRAEAEEQRGQLALVEADLREIREERDSLRDVAQNLPRSCPPSQGLA